VLRRPFTGLASVGHRPPPAAAPTTLLCDRFPVREQAANSRIPTVIIHGDRDAAVPRPNESNTADHAPMAHVLPLVHRTGTQPRRGRPARL
jgi:hypothetical protein